MLRNFATPTRSDLLIMNRNGICSTISCTALAYGTHMEVQSASETTTRSDCMDGLVQRDLLESTTLSDFVLA